MGGKAEACERGACCPVNGLLTCRACGTQIVGDHAGAEVIDFFKAVAAHDSEFAGAPEMFERGL